MCQLSPIFAPPTFADRHLNVWSDGWRWQESSGWAPWLFLIIDIDRKLQSSAPFLNTLILLAPDSNPTPFYISILRLQGGEGCKFTKEYKNAVGFILFYSEIFIGELFL